MSEPVLLGYQDNKPEEKMTSVEESGEKAAHEYNGGAAYNHTNEKRGDVNGDIGRDNIDMVEVKVKNGKEEQDGEKKEPPPPAVGFFELFRFGSCVDVMLMIIGSIAALIHGSAMPLMIIVFGDMIDLFIGDANLGRIYDFINSQYNLSTVHNISKSAALGDFNIVRNFLVTNNITIDQSQIMNLAGVELLANMTTYAWYFTGIGAGVILLGYIQNCCWLSSAERQGHNIRLMFYKAVLHQEIGWFDTHEPGELNSRMSDDINKIQDGMGDKLGYFLQYFSAFLAGFIVGFIYGWKLTLVILAASPVIVIMSGVLGQLNTYFTAQELKAYAKAGAVAEEVLGSMRTVVAFGGEEQECIRYNSNLSEARKFGVKKSLIGALALGLLFFFMFCTYALAFWYGAKLTRDEPANYTLGRMLIVFFCVLIGAFSIGNAAPNIQNFATARGAAYVVFQIIDNKPSIDSSSEEGLKPDRVEGNIVFHDVHFTYPSRPDVPVLQGLNLTVNTGQTVALVGSSGCGKSTTVQLIQRFYDVASGKITLDGQDIRELNINWLRENLGVVSQEPVLFGLTIAENIRYGRLDVTNEEMERAAKEANAHDFIMQLPQKYETMVGERGAQMSGGQKQRIAITRALVRNPKILLLDEATSALDTESESTVQAALDKARMGRTTIVIAHRLSTIQTADVIVGVEKGVAVEFGTHDELMQREGIYYKLVTSQTSSEEEELIEDDDDERQPPGYYEVATSDSPLKRMDSKGQGVKSMQRVTSISSRKGVERSMSVVSTKKEEEEEKLPDPPIGRIMKLNSSEGFYIFLGCFGALINGGVQPAFAMMFAEIMGVFTKERNEQDALIVLYSCMFLVIAAAALVAAFLQGYMFGISGEYLTERLRKMAFRALMRQDMSYFDDHKNNTGALCTRLATEASAVQGATGARLGTIIQSIVSIVIALVIGFIFSWQLTLLIIAFVPVLFVAGILQMQQFTGQSTRDKEALENAGKIAIESIENMRTVAGLTREEKFYQEYSKQLHIPHRDSLKKAHLQGFLYGFSQGIVFFAYAGCFTLGAYLIEQNQLDFTNMMRVFGVMVFSALSLGNANSFAPDYSKAKSSAARIFALLDREPLIDSFSTEGNKLENCSGQVDLREVQFNYPTRPDVPILQGLNVSVKPGQRLALVGSSGCGKSTTIQLIERFYDPKEGQVLLDGQDNKSLNIQWMRSQIGIVSQEPVLFDKTLAENIAYGDTSRQVDMDEIISAARAANIHDFITSLPGGYDTNVGDRGAQLSGGQKQRVAIARALLRNPKILLLDEATSALDTESEKVVQEALDRAQEGRTSIVIAHRLSTIQNADCIAVLRQGTVVEMGTHNELMAQQGFYYKLNSKLLQK